MITIFNRKKLVATFDVKKQSKIKLLLTQHHIPYTVRTINQKQLRQATLGKNFDFYYEYIIYVKKQDYPEASYLLNQARI